MSLETKYSLLMNLNTNAAKLWGFYSCNKLCMFDLTRRSASLIFIFHVIHELLMLLFIYSLLFDTFPLVSQYIKYCISLT